MIAKSVKYEFKNLQASQNDRNSSQFSRRGSSSCDVARHHIYGDKYA